MKKIIDIAGDSNLLNEYKYLLGDRVMNKGYEITGIQNETGLSINLDDFTGDEKEFFREVYDAFQVDKIAYNSQNADEKAIFVAICGESADGHNFIGDAFKRGCRIFVVCRKLKELPKDSLIITVSDTRIALSHMSSVFFDEPSKKLRVIGITGTKGKTTIANYTAQILNKCGVNTGVIGTNGIFYNGRNEKTINTTPESYEIHRILKNMVDEGVKCVCMEVSSGGLKMNRVAHVSFYIGLFNNISPDHIGPKEHPDFEDYFQSKASIFKLAESGIVNIDDEYGAVIKESICKDAKTVSIWNENADYIAVPVEEEKKTHIGAEFQCIIKRDEGEEKFNVKLQSPGEFTIYNALCALSIADMLNISPQQAASELRDVKVEGRMQIIDDLKGVNIVIDYAHNKVSFENLFDSLKNFERKRTICIFGAQGGRTMLRRRELGEIAGQFCDIVIVTSENPDFEDPMKIIDDIAEHIDDKKCKIIKEIDREKAIEIGIDISMEGDLVIVAGKGHEDYILIEGERIPFKDEIAIQRAIKLKNKKQS